MIRRLAVAAAQVAALGLGLLALLATTPACRTGNFTQSYGASGDCGPAGIETITSRSCDLSLSGVGWLPASGKIYEGGMFRAGGPASLTPPLHLADGTPFTPPGGGTGPFDTTLDCYGTPTPTGYALSCSSVDGPVCTAALTPQP